MTVRDTIGAYLTLTFKIKELVMSEWTHILGVIRFDSMAQICYPEPRNKKEIVEAEADLVNRVFQTINSPTGSEGPLQIETRITSRGPAVLITGDLRDYGRENIDEVVTWLNESTKAVSEGAKKENKMMFLRDAFVNCEVEFDDHKYIIQPNADENIFELKIYPPGRAAEKGQSESKGRAL